MLSSSPFVWYPLQGNADDRPSSDIGSFGAGIDDTGICDWKIIKGKKEGVWPPNLDAVLLEDATLHTYAALEKYKLHYVGPLTERSRFPMRNRFISDYIYEVTGKRRTPKQISSRLQRIRDTCKKSEPLKLVSYSNTCHEPLQNSTKSLGYQIQEPATAIDCSQKNIINAEIIIQDSLDRLPIPIISLGSTAASPLTPFRIHLAPSARVIVNPSMPCIGLSGRDSTVTIHSPFLLFTQAIFSVFFGGCKNPTYRELGSLRCQSSPPEMYGHVYSSTLIPTFWNIMCQDKDPTKYIIEQEIIPLQPGPQGAGHSAMTITIVYRFSLSPNITSLAYKSQVYPPLPLGSSLFHEPQYISSIPIHDNETWPSQDTPGSSQQDTSAVELDLQTLCRDNTEIMLPHVSFPYMSSDQNGADDGPTAEGSSYQEWSYSVDSWLRRAMTDDINLQVSRMTSLHQVEYPASF